MKKSRIIYVYDALCGWCYGFSPVMEAFYERHREAFDFEVYSGGMVMGERIGPIGEVAGYIRQAYRVVEERTGVRFGQSFLEGVLEPGTVTFSSEPPALAMTAFRELRPDAVVPFSGDLLRAVYRDGIAPTDFDEYGKRAANYGLDPEEFVARMQEEETRLRTQADFQEVARMGVSGFPTLIYDDGRMHRLSHGYMPLEQLEETLKKLTKTEH